MGARFYHFLLMWKKLQVALSAKLQILFVVFASNAFAQNEPPPQGVFIVGDPPETTIRLLGAYQFIGKTPFTISQNLSGNYTLIASMRGYESKSIEIVLGNQPVRTIMIKLQPLSRSKAAFRSLVLPGWGQRYKGADGRGLLFTGLAIGAGVGALVTHQNYRSAVDDAEQAQRRFEEVQHDFTAAQAALNAWQHAHRKVEESYDDRRRALLITAAVWSLNFLDAILMPPGPGSAPKPGVSLSHQLGYNDLQIGVQFSF